LYGYNCENENIRIENYRDEYIEYLSICKNTSISTYIWMDFVERLGVSYS
jgi:hypothetical protein